MLAARPSNQLTGRVIFPRRPADLEVKRTPQWRDPVPFEWSARMRNDLLVRSPDGQCVFPPRFRRLARAHPSSLCIEPHLIERSAVEVTTNAR